MIPTTNKKLENYDFFFILFKMGRLNSSYRHEMLVVPPSLQEKGNVQVSVKVCYTHKLN